MSNAFQLNYKLQAFHHMQLSLNDIFQMLIKSTKIHRICRKLSVIL